MCGIGRRRAQRPLDYSGDVIVIDCARPAGARLIEQLVDMIGQKAPTPLADRMLVNAKFCRYDLALQTLGAAQNNPASLRERARRPVPPHLSLKIRTLIRRPHQWLNRTTIRQCVRHQCVPLRKRLIQCNLLQFQMTRACDRLISDAMLRPNAGICSACPALSGPRRFAYKRASGGRCWTHHTYHHS